MKKLSTCQLVENKPSPSKFKRKPRNPIYIVLENIRSLYNVGAIFRTSDAVLIKKLYLCGITGYPPRKEISKTALGTTEFIPWEYHKDATKIICNLKNKKIKIIALEQTDGSIEYTKAKYQFPLCLVLGHEREGISEKTLNLCDFSINIPMLGMANSLNVATAYGVVVFEILRKYQNDNK